MNRDNVVPITQEAQRSSELRKKLEQLSYAQLLQVSLICSALEEGADFEPLILNRPADG